MKAHSILFFKEGIKFRLAQQEAMRSWIRQLISVEKFNLENLNFIFCSDRYLLKLNREYLHHKYFTDIITFDNSTEAKTISGDVYISIDRVRANAEKYNVPFRDELDRVIIHGVLHLLGYQDKSASAKKLMRKKEDLWLGKRDFK